MNILSLHVTLVQFIDTSGNVNYTVIIYERCKHDSNYERALPFMKELYDLICYANWWRWNLWWVLNDVLWGKLYESEIKVQVGKIGA